MAGKSALPLLAVAGGAALLLSGKKKKKSAKNGKRELEPVDWVEVAGEAGGDAQLSLDAECASIANKLNMEEHNSWLTNRYFQLVSEGMTDLGQVTVQLLKDQSEHCPWGEPAQWTPLMTSLHGQLLNAVQGWHERTEGATAPG